MTVNASSATTSLSALWGISYLINRTTCGLILCVGAGRPSGQKAKGKRPDPISARGETVTTGKFFQTAMARGKRFSHTDDWYECIKTPYDTKKIQPIFIRLKSRALISFTPSIYNFQPTSTLRSKPHVEALIYTHSSKLNSANKATKAA